jgi:hypothetical protein
MIEHASEQKTVYARECNIAGTTGRTFFSSRLNFSEKTLYSTEELALTYRCNRLQLFSPTRKNRARKQGGEQSNSEPVKVQQGEKRKQDMKRETSPSQQPGVR